MQVRRVHTLEDELSVSKAETARLHDNNIRLSERGDNFEQTFDAVEARLAAEQAKGAALADQTDLLRDRVQVLWGCSVTGHAPKGPRARRNHSDTPPLPCRVLSAVCGGRGHGLPH